MKILGMILSSLIVVIAFLTPVSPAASNGGAYPSSPPGLASKARASTERMYVIQYNTDRKPQTWAAFVSRLENMQAQGKPAFGMAQEVCRGDFMSTYLSKNDQWAFSYRYRFNDSGKCPGDDHGLGDVVAYNYAPQALVTQLSFDFQGTPASDKKGMTCINTPWYFKRVVACSTHLPPAMSQAQRDDHLQQIKSSTSAWSNQGNVVVLGGDFNTRPSNSAMNKLYRSNYGGNGSMSEIHQMECSCRNDNNYPTNIVTGQKIDYIWFNAAQLPSVPGAAFSHYEQNTGSQHKLIEGQAWVNAS